MFQALVPNGYKMLQKHKTLDDNIEKDDKVATPICNVTYNLTEINK